MRGIVPHDGLEPTSRQALFVMGVNEIDRDDRGEGFTISGRWSALWKVFLCVCDGESVVVATGGILVIFHDGRGYVSRVGITIMPGKAPIPAPENESRLIPITMTPPNRINSQRLCNIFIKYLPKIPLMYH